MTFDSHCKSCNYHIFFIPYRCSNWVVLIINPVVIRQSRVMVHYYKIQWMCILCTQFYHKYVKCPANVSWMFWHPKWIWLSQTSSDVFFYSSHWCTCIWNLFWTCTCMNKWTLESQSWLPIVNKSFKGWIQWQSFLIFLLIITANDC